jgi:uncharacterized membrane protein
MLILTGFTILFSALLLEAKVSGSSAFIVFIGPFPLAVGFGEYSPMLILLGIVIAVFTIIIMLMSLRHVYGKKES